VLVEESGHERMSLSRPLKGLPGVAVDTLFRANAALLVGEAEDAIMANGLLEDVLDRK
jgi:hypothetical protein